MYELNNRAVELSKQGLLDEAINLFEEALDKSPDDSNINFNIALVFIKKEKFERAIFYLEKSIELEPGDDNLREIGVCYIRLKEFEKAKEYLTHASEEYGSSDTENVLGVLYFQMQHFKEAKRHFTNATQLNPDDKDAWFNLADTLKELKMKKEAKLARDNYKKLEKN